GIGADGLDARDIHVLLADLQHFLPRAVSPHFRRGRINPQVLDRQPVSGAVVECDLEYARFLMQLDFGRTNDVLRHERWRQLKRCGPATAGASAMVTVL